MLFIYCSLIVRSCYEFFFFFFNDTATTEIYTLSLHDALPICIDERGHERGHRVGMDGLAPAGGEHIVVGAAPLGAYSQRSEEHTSELQSQSNLVCRLLLEKKKNNNYANTPLYTALSHAYLRQS